MNTPKKPTVVSGSPKPLRKLTKKQQTQWDLVVGMFAKGELGQVDSYLIQELIDTYTMVTKIRDQYRADPTSGELRLAHKQSTDHLLKLYDALGISPKARHKKGHQGALKGASSAADSSAEVLEAFMGRLGGGPN